MNADPNWIIKKYEAQHNQECERKHEVDLEHRKILERDDKWDDMDILMVSKRTILKKYEEECWRLEKIEEERALEIKYFTMKENFSETTRIFKSTIKLLFNNNSIE